MFVIHKINQFFIDFNNIVILIVANEKRFIV
jgi:hypothetical protein